MGNGFRMFETKFQVLNINIELVKIFHFKGGGRRLPEIKDSIFNIFDSFF